MNKLRRLVLAGLVASVAMPLTLFNSTSIYAAYNHFDDTDSEKFRTVYPAVVGTKLDSCTLCHGGGSYTSGGKTTTLGSCQWCHYVTNYGEESSPENLQRTLNQYGKDYLANGRDPAAFSIIEALDSDGDTYSNKAEIEAIRYPGDAADTPAKVPAPSRVFTLEELENMPQHTQFMMMNASKSDDSYTRYTGVAMEALIKSIALNGATGITVFSPDGFATYHPFNQTSNPNSYHVYGTCPQGTFYYNETADIAESATGWCDYTSPGCAGQENGGPIINPDGLKMLLAIKHDGEYLTPGVLNAQNKLDGEGPFRVVVPQKNPAPADQRSTASDATDPDKWVWPYSNSTDHNAGFSSRTVTMIRVEPLPEGTTDINIIEAGWPYVDQNKIVIYGAINPVPSIEEKIDLLNDSVQGLSVNTFKNPSYQRTLIDKISVIEKQISRGEYAEASEKLERDVMQKTDGFVLKGNTDGNDWVTDREAQSRLYWTIYEIEILLKILA